MPFGCKSLPFGCMSMERLGACMRLLGAKYAVVGCMYAVVGWIYAVVGCIVCGCWVHSMRLLGACIGNSICNSIGNYIKTLALEKLYFELNNK